MFPLSKTGKPLLADFLEWAVLGSNQ
jgi:hypothetical protein